MNFEDLNFIEVSKPQNNVIKIILNRPEVHNAFNALLIAELTEIAKQLNNNQEIRVVILSGKGRSFCAGADLHWMQKTQSYSKEENYEDAIRLGQMFQALNNLPQAVIGRIHGSAIGGGTGLVSICDISVGVTRAKFGFSEVNLGITPAVISPFVVAKIGLQYAREYFITGERFTAQRAQEIRLLNYVETEENDMDVKIQQLIQEILTSGPKAVQHAKALLRQLSIPSREIHDYMAQAIADLRVSVEGQEGISAFLEKRKPNWHPNQ